MKTVQLYISGAKLRPSKEAKVKYVGLLVYKQQQKLYTGCLRESYLIPGLLYGVVHGRELLKEIVTIKVKTNYRDLINFVQDPSYYCSPLQKLKKYQGQIFWEMFSKDDPYGKYILEKLQ